MNSALWNWSWLGPIGIVITGLGTLYLAIDFLDKRYLFLKVLTQGLTFGLLMAFLFGLMFEIAKLLPTFTYFILTRIFRFDTSAIPSPPFYLSEQEALLSVLIDGFIISLTYSIVREYKIKVIGKRLNFLLPLVGLLLIAGSFVSFSLDLPILSGFFRTNFDPLLLCAWVMGNLGGFIAGFICSQIRISRRRTNALLVLSIFMIASLSFILYVLLPFSYGFVELEELLTGEIFLGFVFGFTLSNSLQPQKVVKRISWFPFLLWLASGNLSGVIFYYIASTAGYGTTKYLEIGIIIYYICLIIGIINGQGDIIIKKIKLRYKYLKKYDVTEDLFIIKELGMEDLTTIKKIEPYYQNMLEMRNYYPQINWKRMRVGFIIGFLYGLSLALLSVLEAGEMHSYYLVPLIYYSILNLSAPLQYGLIIGLIYGFGVMIFSYVEQATKRRLGRIGLLLAVLGTFIVAFSPH